MALPIRRPEDLLGGEASHVAGRDSLVRAWQDVAVAASCRGLMRDAMVCESDRLRRQSRTVPGTPTSYTVVVALPGGRGTSGEAYDAFWLPHGNQARCAPCISTTKQKTLLLGSEFGSRVVCDMDYMDTY